LPQTTLLATATNWTIMSSRSSPMLPSSRSSPAKSGTSPNSRIPVAAIRRTAPRSFVVASRITKPGGCRGVSLIAPNLHRDVRRPDDLPLRLWDAGPSNSGAQALAALESGRMRHHFPLILAVRESVAYLNLHRQQRHGARLLRSRRITLLRRQSL